MEYNSIFNYSKLITSDNAIAKAVCDNKNVETFDKSKVFSGRVSVCIIRSWIGSALNGMFKQIRKLIYSLSTGTI